MKLVKLMNILLAVTSLAGCSVSEGSVEILVKNNGDTKRYGEIIEISLDELKGKLDGTSQRISVSDEDGNIVPCQITHDGFLIFPVDVQAHNSMIYRLTECNAISFDTISCGKVYPERLDDLAWENDKSGYRAYGPGFQKKGNKGFGYDILSKKVSQPVLEQRYSIQLDSVTQSKIITLKKEGKLHEADSINHSISYHVDHGNGMDCYNVGSSLGAGTTALLVDSAIVYPYCYKDVEILDNGPLRFTAQLVFNPIKVNNNLNVIETRIISLDKGSYLNKTKIKYSGLSDSETIVSGIVLHSQNPDGYVLGNDGHYLAYADSTNNTRNDNGVIYVGAVFSSSLLDMNVRLFDKPQLDAIGHILAYNTYIPDSTFTYFWGSGWSKNGITSIDEWTKYLKAFSYNINNPLDIMIR